MNITHGTRAANIKYITQFVLKCKSENPGYRVLDLGGSRLGWTAGFADLVVDLNGPGLKFDLCRGLDWTALFDVVEELGRFDLCICTHTLEDLYNPQASLEFMPLVAKSGFISAPSVRTELSFGVEHLAYTGHMHHRWLFDQLDGAIALATKLPYLTADYPLVPYSIDQEEIMYHWTGSCPYTILNGGYLGPDTLAVVNMYRKFIDHALAHDGGPPDVPRS